MFAFNLCLCRVYNTLSTSQQKTIHPKGMEVVVNVTETCDKEVGQKLLLKGGHVHMDILVNHLKDLEKMQGEKCWRSTITSKNPRQEEAEVQS